MDNLNEKSCCGKSLFPFFLSAGLDMPSGGVRRLSHDEEVTFAIANNPILYLQLGSSNDIAIENLCHRIARDPQDLRAHIQRIALYMRTQNNEGVYSALIDLFIALGEKGGAIRKRMFSNAEPYLSDKRKFFFSSILHRGIRDTDPVPDAHVAVLCKGYIGNNNFIVESAHNSCTYEDDPRQEANDCLSYGQVDEARKILEQAVLQEPWREDLQTDLLEIYWATRDVKACQAMYERLADEFIPDHHAWIKVVERISDAVGGA